ncbi:MAG: hypothetical protein ACYDGR_13645 [Candidatus Dormibacteria bacterium]
MREIRLSRRHGLFAVVAALLASSASTAGPPAVSPRAPRVAMAGFRGCADGTMPERDALAANGASPRCVPAVHPETFADLAARDGQLAARTSAPFGSTAPGARAAAVSQKRTLAPAGTLPGSGGNWQAVGKSPYRADDPAYPNVVPLGFKGLSGRITAFAYDPAVAGHFWAAPSAGGVWESTDGAQLWRSIGDPLPTEQMGALTYDMPLKRLFAGTGDNAFGGDSYAGLGLFYSDNDGGNWIRSAGVPGDSLLFKVAVSGADASGNTVFAATSLGLFRSTDGGVSFVNVNLPTSPTGYLVLDQNVNSPTHNQYVDCKGRVDVPLCFFASIVTDVVVKKSTSSNAPAGAVMAVVGWRAGNRANKDAAGAVLMSCKLAGAATPCLQAPQNGLYLSTTGAPGSFTYQTHPVGNPLYAAGMDFAPNPIVGRTTLGIAEGAGQNNDAVYALVQDAVKFQGCSDDPLDSGNAVACQSTVTALGLATVLDGAYASYDFGKTWTKIMNYTQLKLGGNSALVGLVGYSPGVQAWYNNWIEPDPTGKDSSGNPTRVAFGLEEIWENNSLDPTVLTTPYLAHPGVSAASPWIVIGRYWNACAGVAALPGNVGCSPTVQSGATVGSTTHPDQHGHAFIPDGKGGVSLLAGSDGGAFIQHVAAGADFDNSKWIDSNNGLHTLQPYDAEIAKDGTIMAGLQDNGENKITPDGAQREVFGGDAFFSTIDPNNSKNILEEYTYAGVSLSNDGGVTWIYDAPATDPAGQVTTCDSTNSLFSTPIEQDPTTPGHVLIGCGPLQETTAAYTSPCIDPTCNTFQSPFATSYDLGTAPSGAIRIPSALAVRQENEYVGWCGYCDIVTGKLPFDSGIDTNVGDKVPGKIGTSNGWHKAAALCPACGTANGKLPKRYINSVREDPGNARTIYVTLGGYGRRWIPPGSLGDDVSNVGVGNVFKSTDAGQTFKDISGDLPDAPANWTVIHDGHLVVATEVGVFESGDTNGGHYGILGNGLPNSPVFTLRLDPSNPDRMIASTYGRGVYQYVFSAASSTAPTSTPTPTQPQLPNTGAGFSGSRLPLPAIPIVLVLPGIVYLGTRARSRARRRC